MSKLKVEALRRCLVEVRLPGAFIDHCLDKLKMESARTTLLRNEHKKHQGETVEELECALESRAVDTGDLVATVPAYVSSRD